jgi:adenylate cyclase
VDAFLTAATKFVQLTATQLDHLFQTLALRRQQVQLESLLPPAVVRALAGQPNLADVLKPQVVTATVMLCDLRGFSALAEKSPLPELLQRVNLALSEMTTFITEFDGVIGDFQGDSALGFWGWPAPTPDQAELAARAALAVRRRFQKGVAHFDELLADFSCGIGLAHGECVAGRLGTADLMKVGVFGPVVNLAARLEGLTKTFGVPVVVDAALATELRATGAGRFVLRRLARVRPAGMTKTVEIFELLPREADRPVSLERPRITDRNLTDYEEGLALFERGDWSAALMVLSRVPGHDGPSSFLRRYIDAAGGMPSADWEGMVAFQKPAG